MPRKFTLERPKRIRCRLVGDGSDVSVDPRLVVYCVYNVKLPYNIVLIHHAVEGAVPSNMEGTNIASVLVFFNSCPLNNGSHQ